MCGSHCAWHGYMGGCTPLRVPHNSAPSCHLIAELQDVLLLAVSVLRLVLSLQCQCGLVPPMHCVLALLYGRWCNGTACAVQSFMIYES